MIGIISSLISFLINLSLVFFLLTDAYSQLIVPIAIVSLSISFFVIGLLGWTHYIKEGFFKEGTVGLKAFFPAIYQNQKCLIYIIFFISILLILWINQKLAISSNFFEMLFPFIPFISTILLTSFGISYIVIITYCKFNFDSFNPTYKRCLDLLSPDENYLGLFQLQKRFSFMKPSFLRWILWLLVIINLLLVYISKTLLLNTSFIIFFTAVISFIIILTPKKIAILYQILQLFIALIETIMFAIVLSITVNNYFNVLTTQFPPFPIKLIGEYILFTILYIINMHIMKNNNAFSSLEALKEYKNKKTTIILLITLLILGVAIIPVIVFSLRTGNCIPLFYVISSIIIIIISIISAILYIFLRQRLSNIKYLYDKNENLS